MSKRDDHQPADESQRTGRWLPASAEESLSNVDRMLYNWLTEHHESEVQTFRERLPRETWIQLSAATLEEYNSDLYYDLIHSLRDIESGNDRSIDGIKSLLEPITDEETSPQEISIRWRGISDQRLVGEYKATETEQLHSIEGQVDLTTDVNPVIDTAVFKCERCGTKTSIEQERTSDDLIEPHECPGCERQGPFNLKKGQSDMIDYQELRLQTPPEHTGNGVEHLTVSAAGDLAGEHSGSIGQRVIVNGYLTTKDTGDWERPYRLQARDIVLADDTKIDIEAYREEIDAVEQEDDPIPTLVDSKMLPDMYAPEGSDLRMLKMAVLLQACSPTTIGGGKRGNIHLFACGDPSTGKSDVAELAADIVPSSEFVSTRVTGVGLTGAAVNTDLNGWTVKAGALVRADGGVVVIDELDKIDDDHIGELHEPLESQIVPINVADQSVTFQIDTSVLATANPKFGRWDQYEPIAEQLDIDDALLSRFDLILTMEDNVDPERDAKIADAVVEQYSETLPRDQSDDNETTPDNTELLQAWIVEADTYSPTIPPKQDEKLKQFYQDVRGAADNQKDAVPVTPRQLAGMMRLAKASACARHDDVVKGFDVQRTIELVKQSLQDVGVDPDTGEYDADLIETGASKSQRNRVKSIISVVSELSGEYDDGVPKKKAILEMYEEGFDPEKAEKTIDRALQKGDLYEPMEDRLRPT
jgi:replicative DNA helicase Mcm